ncbi:MAG: hypothetical protein ABEJ35_03480 [Halobacteriaceae archaeon]
MGASDDPDSGLRALVDALAVPRLAAIGFGIGTLFAVGVFVFFVVIPGPDRSPALYLALAFVLALSVGLLVTIVAVAVKAYLLIQDTTASESRTAEDLESRD